MLSSKTTADPGLLSSGQSRRVLIVEDDLTSREYLRLALAKSGFATATADNVTMAQQHLIANGFKAFDCVVTDYRMPGLSGLDLLAWLKKEAPSLATIILTAEGEKQLVTQSLRGGAADFLEKPVNIQELRRAVTKAVDLTHRQRRADEVECAVKELGRVQQRMIHASGVRAAVNVEICFHPKLEAGGDSFSHFQPEPHQYFCLLTDVSGHDLQAGYISAYFQGVVRGMLDCATPVPDIIRSFNRFLVEEWNQTENASSAQTGTDASVAICSVLMDLQEQTAVILTSGVPAPVYVSPNGRAKAVGPSGGYPLGWFANYEDEGVQQKTGNDGFFLLWTDGLAELAEKLEASPLSLAYRLAHAKNSGHRLEELDAAEDDVLLASIYLPEQRKRSKVFSPLVMEQYNGSQMVEIDQMEAFWRRSLRLALPELPSRIEHDLMLASREAVLNALKHGCGGQAAKNAAFQISYDRNSQMVRVWVDDSGPGHQFDFINHEKNNAACLIDEHRGLLLINNLASAIRFESNRASIIMDFVF